MGLGEWHPKVVETAVDQLAVTPSKPVVTKAKKSVEHSKLREEQDRAMVTLTRAMYEFHRAD